MKQRNRVLAMICVLIAILMLDRVCLSVAGPLRRRKLCDCARRFSVGGRRCQAYGFRYGGEWFSGVDPEPKPGSQQEQGSHGEERHIVAAGAGHEVSEYQ